MRKTIGSSLYMSVPDAARALFRRLSSAWCDMCHTSSAARVQLGSGGGHELSSVRSCAANLQNSVLLCEPLFTVPLHLFSLQITTARYCNARSCSIWLTSHFSNNGCKEYPRLGNQNHSKASSHIYNTQDFTLLDMGYCTGRISPVRGMKTRQADSFGAASCPYSLPHSSVASSPRRVTCKTFPHPTKTRHETLSAL